MSVEDYIKALELQAKQDEAELKQQAAEIGRLKGEVRSLKAELSSEQTGHAVQTEHLESEIKRLKKTIASMVSAAGLPDSGDACRTVIRFGMDATFKCCRDETKPCTGCLACCG